MTDALPTAELPTRTDPPAQDRPVDRADQPSSAVLALGALRWLIGFGKGMAYALQRIDLPHNLRLIRHRFGYMDLVVVGALITRGLIRAAALEKRLIKFALRKQRSDAADAGASRLSPAPRTEAAEHCPDDVLTLEEILAKDRRRPIGVVFAGICADLGIMSSDAMWRDLYCAIAATGGNILPLFRVVLARSHDYVRNTPTEILREEVEHPTWPSIALPEVPPDVVVPAIAPPDNTPPATTIPALAPSDIPQPAWLSPYAPVAAASGAGPP